MPDFSNGPDIRAAVDRAASRLGERAPAADIEREAEKILASEWRGAYGSPGSRTPCRLTLDVCVSDCTSRLPATVRALLYDRIRNVGSALSSAARSLSARPAPRPRLHLRLPDSAVLTAGHSVGIESLLISILDRAAPDAGIDVIEGPVLQLACDSDLGMLETLPDLLRRTNSVRPVLEIDDSSDGFVRDALYGIALSLLAPGSGPHAAEVAVTTSASGRKRAFSSRPSLTVTVTAGTGSDLAHAGREAFRVGRTALDELVAASSGQTVRFQAGAVIIALSTEHAGAVAERISAGSVRDALLSDVPRGVQTDVVVDGYPLAFSARNRLSATADTDPRVLAAELGARLGILSSADGGRSTGGRTRTGPTPAILLSAPAVPR